MITRIAEPGRPAFQLRKGEEGLSVFLADSVVPPLDDSEILGAFRPGNVAVVRSLAEIEAKGLVIVPIPGADPLPSRLRQAHAEIRSRVIIIWKTSGWPMRQLVGWVATQQGRRWVATQPTRAGFGRVILAQLLRPGPGMSRPQFKAALKGLE